MNKPKILLIHGWDHANYTSSGCKNAWSKRSKFVKALSELFSVVAINLPGFCGEPDPQQPWNLDDYVSYIDKVMVREKPDAILGYSFGGAIVLRWKKTNMDKKVQTFLVSPAIIRRYEKADLSLLQKILKRMLPEKLVSLLRDIYLTQVVKNPFYSKATGVMRTTYRNIVAVDLRDDLLGLQVPVTLIYGEKDTATPPEFVREVVGNARARHELFVISSGSHDIANSHTTELVNIIAEAMGKEDGNDSRSEDTSRDTA
ncbi:MAG: hypothetical protein A2758_00805 [Candidatus Zambryskibacteria bacterium RIFCSPHIGHO2_01_FULL_49_18]|uniref:AB hydrolase-1 domain-containing protein n=2 Tax=Candidatus Zambryskiibacteriota TaxID=1817925 RepID=A0A1G2T4V9_9BACT|nr:MAG: hypothetical protein A2758_00805 [Candidatus Zambryskibacteria bacterium RIFCSPHIGHO2_01_FULL_49_18]OHB05754.1 MAG: hypothetical protein A3A26_03675 [Candidatus Zambryskibacteria bacterium RIFCSPLOWO2_01_FULL_47_14]